MTDVIPARYKKFDIGFASLLEFLRTEYGQQPNNWPFPCNIEKFINDQYKISIAPQIKEKIRDEKAEDLKQKLLQLADDNPELGLMFWEG
jgi:hypothetical protein